MTDESSQTAEPSSDASEPVATQQTPRRRMRKWLAITVGGLVFLPLIGFLLWSWFALSYSYSSGDRAGYVQKFSKKGWVCKTWEGELSMINIPGAMQERWLFTVRDDSVARVVQDLMGKQVSLTYEEHPGVPSSCFSETRYYVTGVRRVP